MRCYEDPATDGDDDDRTIYSKSKRPYHKSRFASAIHNIIAIQIMLFTLDFCWIYVDKIIVHDKLFIK